MTQFFLLLERGGICFIFSIMKAVRR